MKEFLPNTQPVIDYPYMPEGGRIQYVPADHKFMQIAKAYAQRESYDQHMPNCSVIVRDGEILGIAANGSDYHELYGCERKRLNSPTGQDYDKCEGCSPENHGEAKAIANALSSLGKNVSLEDAEVYLWGHWWCCEPCWNRMLGKGINTVNLIEKSQILFNRDVPGNIVGHQFDIKDL